MATATKTLQKFCVPEGVCINDDPLAASLAEFTADHSYWESADAGEPLGTTARRSGEPAKTTDVSEDRDARTLAYTGVKNVGRASMIPKPFAFRANVSGGGLARVVVDGEGFYTSLVKGRD
jgi:hypothetical protein